VTRSQPKAASSPPEATPPLLPRPGWGLGSLAPVVVVLAALAGLQWWQVAQLPLPGCVFRAMTGHPCPFCGGLRAALALTQGELGTALAWNPLVTLGIVASLLAWPLWRALGPGRQGSLVRRWRPIGVGLMTLAVAGNWLYLWLAGTR